jgi:hypothetical protein
MKPSIISETISLRKEDPQIIIEEHHSETPLINAMSQVEISDAQGSLLILESQYD